LREELGATELLDGYDNHLGKLTYYGKSQFLMGKTPILIS